MPSIARSASSAERGRPAAAAAEAVGPDAGDFGLRVARIPYLNAKPFYAEWGERPPFEVQDMVPSRLGEAARNGRVDAGLMAVTDYFSLDSFFEPITPRLGVAARASVRSVLLLSHEPPRGLDGATIVLTEESSTSVRLLDLLASGAWGVEPRWIRESEAEGAPRQRVDGQLLIGDRALEVMADPHRGGWTRTTDLAAEWWRWQSLPFVFALWTVRSSVPRRDRERFAGFVTGALAVGVNRLERIAREGPARLGSPDALEQYLSNLVYRLGADEMEGLQRFRDLLADYDIQEYPHDPV